MIPTCIASGHVIAVISKNVTATQANAILHLLTHDVDGEPVGNAVAVTSAQLLLMHLPMDVLNYVPLTGLQSSPTGDAPAELLDVIVGTIVSAVDFLVNSIIDLGTFMLDVLVTIAEAVLAFYAGLVQAAADAVRAVVDVIVDAFLAFVDWALKFIQELAASLFSPLIDPIANCMNDYYSGIAAASSSIEDDLNTEGSISHQSTQMMINAILGDLFWIMLGIISITALVLSVFSIATGGLSFLTTLALNVLISTLVLTIFGVVDVLTSDSGSSPGSTFYDFIMDKVVDCSGDITPGSLLQTGISYLCAIVDILISANLAMSMGIPDFIANGAAIGFSLGILGLGFCAIGSITNSAMFLMTSLIMSGFGFFSLFTYRSSLTVSNMLGSVSAKQITTIGMVISGCGMVTSLVGLSQEEWFN